MTHRSDDFQNYRPQHDLSDQYAATKPLGSGHGGVAVQTRSRGPLLTIAFYLLLGVVAIIVSGITFLLIAAPTDLIRDEMIAAVKEETGRDLKVAGKTSISFFPSLGIELDDVSLSPPPGMDGSPTVRMETLTVSVPILPLLRRELAVDKLVLHKPVFDLRVDRRGRKSWDFEKPGSRADRSPARPIRLAQASASGDRKTLPPELREFVRGSGPQPELKSGVAGLANLALDDVRIVDGVVRYSDERSGARETVKQINVRLALTSLTAPMTAAGDLAWKDETIRFDGRVGSLKAVLDGLTTNMTMKIDAQPLTVDFNGNVTVHQAAVVEGKLSINAPSLRKFASWMGAEMPRTTGYGPLAIDGRLKTGRDKISLRQTVIKLDGATAKGKIIVETGGIRPFVRTTLQIDELDLNKYIAVASAAEKAKPAGKPEQAPSKTSAPPKSIEELLRRDRPQVRGYTKRAGEWSREPIDIEGLGALDLEGRLSIARLLHKKLKVEQSEIAVVLRNRKLKVNFEDVRLYQGKGRGILTVDATRRVPSFALRFSADNVSARPLLRDAADFDSIAGNGRLTLDLTGSGSNEHAIVSALNGSADFAFFDGAVIGLNIPAMIRAAQRLEFNGWSESATKKTDFSELTASFQIVQGIATNKDFKMSSPLLRITGEGTVSLPPRTLDYVMKPKLVPTLAGQGGDQGLDGVVIPVRMHGPWADPDFTPDLSGVLKDPEGAFKKLTKGVKTDDVRRVLRGLIGGSGKGSGGASEGDAEKLLKRFLGR